MNTNTTLMLPPRVILTSTSGSGKAELTNMADYYVMYTKTGITILGGRGAGRGGMARKRNIYLSGVVHREIGEVPVYPGGVDN